MIKKLCLSSMALFCSLHLSAAINPTGQEIHLYSMLKTPERVLGQVALTVGINDELSIAVEDVEWALGSVLSLEKIAQLKAQAVNGNISDAAFNAAGFALSIDAQNFELLIEIPIEQNRIQSLSLAREKNQTALDSPSPISGYLNTYLRASYHGGDNNASDSFSQQHRIKAGLNAKAANLSYEAEFLDSNKTGSEYNRTFTQLSYDLPTLGTRVMLGDIITPTTSLQQGGDVAGVSIVRNFSDIPTRNLRPTATQQFTLRRSSNIDVIVDGVVIQRLSLPAGRYDLNDIPLARGRNDVELLIEDEAGNEERISFSIAIDNNLIKAGEYEYALTAGIPTSIENNKLRYDDSNIMSTGFIEYGATPSWTVGLNGQYYDDNAQIGFSSLNAWRYGTTELLYQHSEHSKNGSGDGLRLTYATPKQFQDDYHFQVNAQYEYFTEHFARVDSDLFSESPNVEHNTRLSLSSNFYKNYNAGLDVNLRKAHFSAENSWSLSSSLTGPLWDTGATFGLNLRYLQDFDRDDSFDVTANISYSFAHSQRLLARYQSSNEAYSLDYSYRERPNKVGGISLNANVETSENSELALNGDLNYTANRANLGLEHDTRFTSLNSEKRSSRTTVSLDTAIAFSGTSVAIGRPVNESFAIIAPNKNLSNTQIKIQPDSQGNAQVISHNSRTVLVNSLSSYSKQNIAYSVDNLPMGYDLGAGQFSVNPIQGQGYKLSLGTDATHTLIATLMDKKSNQPITLVAGKAYQANKPEITREFFSTKKGRVAVSSLSPGEWILELNTLPVKRVAVTVVKNDDMLDQKGVIYVEE